MRRRVSPHLPLSHSLTVPLARAAISKSFGKPAPTYRAARSPALTSAAQVRVLPLALGPGRARA